MGLEPTEGMDTRLVNSQVRYQLRFTLEQLAPRRADLCYTTQTRLLTLVWNRTIEPGIFEETWFTTGEALRSSHPRGAFSCGVQHRCKTGEPGGI